MGDGSGGDVRGRPSGGGGRGGAVAVCIGAGLAAMGRRGSRNRRTSMGRRGCCRGGGDAWVAVVEAAEMLGWPLSRWPMVDPRATEHARTVVARAQMRERPPENSLDGRVSPSSGVAPVSGAYGSGRREPLLVAIER